MLLLVFDTVEEKNKFIMLYETYGKTIYYTLNRFGLNEHEKEDCSQEIYIIIANHLDNIDINNFKKTQNYIITITRNYCKNYLRSQKKYLEEPLEKFENVHIKAEDILDKIVEEELIQQLAQEIANLNDIYKIVLELKYVNNFSNAEIASILKIKKKTVEMRLYRASQLLRASLKEKYDV